MDRKPIVWIIGDSTVSSFEDNYYMPRVGWGVCLSEFLTDDIEVRNIAVSGTSSKSYTTLPVYGEFLEGIGKGDFLILGFGHNDEKRGASTFTDAHGDYETVGSFAHSLYSRYLRPAMDAGAECILTTPIARRDPTLKYEGEFAHVTADGDYAHAVRDLGRDIGIPVCDLTRQTIEIARAVDTDDIEDNDTLFMHGRTGSRPVCVDDTHTSLFGAMVNAWLVAEDIRKSESGLRAFLKSSYDNPLQNAAYWREKSINREYHDPVYVSPKAPGVMWASYTDANGNIWYGTVFGDLNKEPQECRDEFALGAYGIDKENDISVNIISQSSSIYISAGRLGNNGKITGKSDGLAMYFTRIPVSSRFRLSADVTLLDFNTAGSPADTSAYGLMVRDDMYIDCKVGELMGDYVSAGIVFNTSFPNGANTFARKSGQLTYHGGELSESPAKGKSLHMEIASTGDGYMAHIEGHDPVIAGYDFTLTAVDSEYVYVGFYAARSVSIAAGDISLEMDGQIVKGYDCFKGL